MKSIKLKINTKTQKYSIIIGSNLVSNISKISKNNSINFKKCLLVIDKNISKKIISKIKKSLSKTNLYVHFFNASEINKNQNSVSKILDILLKENFSIKRLSINSLNFLTKFPFIEILVLIKILLKFL